MSKFTIAQNGPYFAATLERMSTYTIGELMVKAQRNLDNAIGARKELLLELVRECAGEYKTRKYPTHETH